VPISWNSATNNLRLGAGIDAPNGKRLLRPDRRPPCRRSPPQAPSDSWTGSFSPVCIAAVQFTTPTSETAVYTVRVVVTECMKVVNFFDRPMFLYPSCFSHVFTLLPSLPTVFFSFPAPLSTRWKICNGSTDQGRRDFARRI